MLRWGLTVAVAGSLAAATTATAAPLGLDDCAQVDGAYACAGLVRTWDGVPIDTTLVLPREGARGLPLVVEVNGFGNSKHEYLNPRDKAYTDNAYNWARDGYAVLTYTARGLWGSCGTPAARLANPKACANGYVHLADARYEVRDAQELIGRLVDEGIADRRRVGVTGDSYGGGQTLMLAALRDRVMLPDGTLIPWHSPAGKRLRLAAAAPVVPWSDLVSTAAPNGRLAPTGRTSRSVATTPVGIEKATFVNAIFAAAQFATGPGQPVGEPFIPGRPMGFLAPPGVDPEADVAAWVTRTTLGEPYDDEAARRIVDLLTSYHSAYYIPSADGPPPLFIAAGFTDDLFPADESLRFAARTARRFPTSPLSVLLGDFGHQRATNKPAERRALVRMIHSWFDRHVKGSRRRTHRGVTAYVQTCPRGRRSLGPLHATSFAALARSRVTMAAPHPQRIDSLAGSPQIGLTIDPVTGGGDACAVVDAGSQPGTAIAERAVGGRRGVTLIGAPKVHATLGIHGVRPDVSQVAARLWDVAPDGETQLLVARGSFRPSGEGEARWYLHPAAYRFAPGHTIRLELLGNDLPYSRPSNGLFSIDVANLRVRLPVRERTRR